MADKIQKATGALNVQALKAAFREVNKAKEAASEATGRAGKATKSACEQHNLNAKAFTLVAGLLKKEPAQQLEVLGAVVTYAHAMGMFDGSDMFNPHVGAMQAVIESATSGKPGAASASASTVAALAAGTSAH